MLQVDNMRWQVVNLPPQVDRFKNMWQVDRAAKAFNILSV